MAIRILLPDLVMTVLTIFPGILIAIQSKLPKFKRLKGNWQYALALMAVCGMNSIKYHCWIHLLIMLSAIIASYTAEFLFNEYKNLDISKIKYEINTLSLPFFVMIVCPVFEEYIYRYFIYQYVMDTVSVTWMYFLISILSFIFCHFMTQQLKSLYKIPLAVIECIIFISFKTILMCIIVHMTYNILVYSHNLQKYMRKNNHF